MPDQPDSVLAPTKSLLGWLEIDRVLRGTPESGCGVGRCGRASKVFIRWAARGVDFGEDQRRKAGPEAEYAALTSIASTGVPEALDLLHESSRVISVTEWIEGETLARGCSDPERLTRELIDILVSAHHAGWVHGDLKPTNLLVDRTGRLVVLDWEGAQRIGELAAPGTLGYAPPWSWAPDYRARPENDYYSACVVLWELLSGTGAFTGSRAEILAAQKAFDFPVSGDVGAAMSALISAVRARGEPRAWFGTAHGSQRQLERSSVISRLPFRRDAARHNHTICAAGALHEDTIQCVEAELPPEDIPAMADAVADEVRLISGWNCINWSTLAVVASTAAASSEAPNAATQSRVDGLRDLDARVGREALRIVQGLQPAVIIRENGGRAPTTREGAWRELRRLLNALAASHRTRVRMVELTPTTLADIRQSSVRQSARLILEATYASRAVEDGALNAVARRRPRSTVDVIQIVRELESRGVIRRHADNVHAVDAADADFTATTRTWNVASTHERGGDEAIPAVVVGDRLVESDLASAEEAAAQGLTLAAFRKCVRVYSYLASDPDRNTDHVFRLADLWIELGNLDAATVVLDTWNGRERELDYLVRRGRLCCARGDFAKLCSILDRIRAVGTSPAYSGELERFEGLWLLSAGRAREAYKRLRTAVRLARSSGLSTMSWPLITLGNALRQLGRSCSARRVLSLARDLAAIEGRVRAGLIASVNLLQVVAKDLAPARVAAEADGLAERCKSWGLLTEAENLRLTSASWWIVAGQPDVARRLLDPIVREIATASGKTSRIRLTIHQRWLEAADLSEHWDSLIQELGSIQPPPTGSSHDLHLALLRHQFGHSTGVSLPARLARPCLQLRAVRAAQRAIAHARVTTERIRAVLRLLEDAIPLESPLVGHTARLLTTLAVRPSIASELVDTALRFVDKLGRPKPFATAMAVEHTVWSKTRNVGVLDWLVRNVAGDERRRPPGVRLWEWQTAMLIACRSTAGRDASSVSIESVLSELERIARQLPQQFCSQFCDRLPLDAIARAAGVNPLAFTTESSLAHSTRELTIIRAALNRHQVEASGTASRASGLERVLQGALKLRASSDIDSLLSDVASGLLAVCRAERAVVIYEVDRGSTRAKVATNEGVVDILEGAAEVSRTALNRVRETGRACIVDDACGDGELGDRPSILQFRPKSLVIAPLHAQGKSIGFVYVENRSIARSFNAADADLIEGFGAQAALALDNARLFADLRKSYRDLELARNEAVRAESLRVLGRLASEVAHDFNNLLASILGESQLLLQDAQTESTRSALSTIERAALDGAAVIRRIQDSTRIRSDREFEFVDVVGVVCQVIDGVRIYSAEKSVSIFTQVDGAVPRIRAVACELREVLTNIVRNAIDASSSGSGVSVSVMRRADSIRIEVLDRGTGMSPETAARIFDPFFTTKGERGNGLGLSIAFGIVRRFGGTIDVKSELGMGTTMSVVLPVAAADDCEQVELHERLNECAAPGTLSGRRVLVVDDEPSVARVLEGMLRRLGATTAVANGGARALQLLGEAERAFDYVITDLHMPDVDGVEVARTAVNSTANTRVVVMSGSLSAYDADPAASLPGIRLLRKPFTLGDVSRALES